MLRHKTPHSIRSATQEHTEQESAVPSTGRYVHQVSRPDGFPAAGNFAFIEDTIPVPGPGTALVENIYLSVDPYMRQMMDGVWDLHTPLEGRSTGRIVESNDPRLPVGEVVFHRQGWRTHAVISPSEPPVRVLPKLDGVPLSTYLSILGGTGLSAYVGLTRIADLKAGESVFISAAGGGVGTAAGQLARVLGAGRVIGSTGSAAKVKHLIEDLGFDAAFSYKDAPVIDQLRQAAPDGIHVYLDNVGGDHLEAAIDSMVDHGRIAWCGAIAQYHRTEPPAAPRNLFDIGGKSIRLEGFAVREYPHLFDEWAEFIVPHLQSGRVVPDHTIVAGFDRVVDAFLGLLRGENSGKMIVQTEAE